MTDLLRNVLPAFAEELKHLLNTNGRAKLGEQVDSLSIVDRCCCGDDFCASFYTQPKPEGSYGPSLECVELEPERGMIILDVVDGTIAQDDVRRLVIERLP
jgi:hypothetical protein